jgi:hypothetical protein
VLAESEGDDCDNDDDCNDDDCNDDDCNDDDCDVDDDDDVDDNDHKHVFLSFCIISTSSSIYQKIKIRS